MVIFKREISIRPLRRKRKSVSKPKQNLLKRLTSRKRTPVVESNILLVAPFDAEKQRVGEALLRYVVGEEARFDDASSEGMVTMPLGERRNGTPLLCSLRGFHENDAGASRALLGMSRALLGMSRHQTDAVDSLQFVERLRMAASVCVVCLDLTVTPLYYDALSEDLSQLREKFGNRLVFVGINAEKLRAWNQASQRKRLQIWADLVPSVIECSLDAEGISKVLAAVSALNSTSRRRDP